MLLNALINHYLPTALSTEDISLTPNLGLVKSRDEIEFEKPFIYSAPMDCVTDLNLSKAMLEAGQVPVLTRFMKKEQRTEAILQLLDTEAFIAVGLNDYDYIAEILSDTDKRINICFDIAHGDSAHAYNEIYNYSILDNVNYIMSGSIANPKCVHALYEAGVTHFRVGIGPGSMCTTRIVTGVGVPQLTAVYLIKKQALKISEDLVVIADGGIRNTGQAVKYLAAGADAIMMGRSLAYAKESPGWAFVRFEKQDLSGVIAFPTPEPKKIIEKTYRGQASKSFQQDFEKPPRLPEGEATTIRYKGDTVESIIKQYKDGVASAISYLGLQTLEQLKPTNVSAFRVTSHYAAESVAHGKT